MVKQKRGFIVTLILSGLLFQITKSHRAEGAAGSNALATIAASMSPGPFALLNREGDGSGYEKTSGATVLGYGGVGTAYAFAQKAAYDPVADRIVFQGAPHDSGDLKGGSYIWYDVSQNKWNSVLLPGFYGHSYDFNTLNPGARLHYVSSFQGWPNRRFNLDISPGISASLPGMANQPMSGQYVIGSWEYFPDRDVLIGVWGDRVFEYRHSTNTWAEIHAGKWSGLRSNAMARYSKPCQCVFIFGGADQTGYDAANNPTWAKSSVIYRYNASGSAPVRLTDMPSQIWVRDGGTSVWWADPPTGKLLGLVGIQNSTGQSWTGQIEFWEFDYTGNQWKKLNSGIIPNPSQWLYSNPGDSEGLFAVLTVPLEKYGVTAILSAVWQGDRQSRVYLYKHSATSSPTPPPPSPDTTAPSAPTNLSATAISASQIDLSWTASTDNVGVTGYRVERCQGSGCTNFVQIATPSGPSYADAGLAAGTTYRYRVRASDAAGNLSGYSSVVAATTATTSGSPGGWTSGSQPVPETLQPKPPAGVWWTDPDLGGSIMRLHAFTDQGAFGHHVYSDLAAWSGNMSYYALIVNDASINVYNWPSRTLKVADI